MSPKKFYAKYIKPCKSLREVDLPNIDYSKPARVERSLIDWRIYYTRWGRKQETHLSCTSEEEARYLKVWLEHGASTIEIPTDKEELQKVVPLLEELVKRVDAILEEDLIGYSAKVRRQVVEEIWTVEKAVQEVIQEAIISE